MMQELLEGNNNISIIGGSPSPSPSSSTTTNLAATANPTTTTPSLRCPRCDSANTKFCYYNNYNLMQPRHLCKTCRRYWTKGGALRNVPIGGGCRKNRGTTVTPSIGKSISVRKLKSNSQEMGKLGIFNGFEETQVLPTNPILWPQNSHLLSLFRANQNPNPNHQFGSNSQFNSEPYNFTDGSNSRVMGMDPLGQLHAPFPPVGLSNSFCRNQGVLLGEVENNGIHELYQRLRSSASTSCYPDHHAPVLLGNVTSSSSNNSSVLESAPVIAGGFWNSGLANWSTDLPTTHGAFP